jgi:Phage terminase large subunit
MSILKIPTAKIFEPLLAPARYKGLYGGRGSGKSHFFGELLVETCQAERGTLAVCIREAQRTLAQSSKRLIEGKISALGLGHGFKVFSDKIETPGDGLVIFRGMQDHTSESIKSLEGFRIAWIDEAQTLSGRSLSLLRPTIRAARSELWASWKGLQLRLMRAMQARVRHNGWSCIVSDTTDNVASANNFIRAGYRLYRPAVPWAWPNTLYWRKPIKYGP